MQVLTRASEVPSRRAAGPTTGSASRWTSAPALGAIVLALALAGCGSAPPAPPASAAPARPGGGAVETNASEEAASACPGWLAAQRRGEGRLYRVDAAASQVRIHVFRAGRLAKAGHNHVLGVERLEGQVFVPADGIAGAGLELGFRLEDLAIDKPEWRAALGPEFASVPSASDIAGTRANLLKTVDGDRFPAISMRSTAVAGAFPVLALKLAVRWHGQSREFDVPVRVARPAGEAALRAQGALVLRQSDFGIAPLSILGGLLAVQDELTVEVDVAARPAASCG